MANPTAGNSKGHKRRQESLSKCKSLPSLQLSADPSTSFTCPRCGLTSSLMVVCTRCYQRNDVEGDDPTAGKEPLSWKLLSENAAENGYVESHNPASQQRSRPVAEQLGHADGSKGPTSQFEAPLIAPLRFSTSFDEPLVDPLSWISERSTGSDLVPSQDEPKLVERDSGRDSLQGASTLQSNLESSHREDDELNPSVVMAPSTVVLAYTQAHSSASAVSLVSGAGSCLPHSSRSSMSSSSRQLRLRSKSLFSLKHRSSTAPSQPDVNRTSTSISSTNSSSTATMFVAARALTKRLSFATLRCGEPTSGASKEQPPMLSESKPSKLSLFHGQEDAVDHFSGLSDREDDGKNRTLRRKKRLDRPPLPQIPATPAYDATFGEDMLSPPESAPESSDSSVRLASTESEKLKAMGVKFALGTESHSGSSLPKQDAPDKGKGVDRIEQPMRTAPAVHVTKPSVDNRSTEEVKQPPAPVGILKRPSPTSSINSSSSTVPPSQPVPLTTLPKAQTYTGPRIGTPSRPYYSVIRKNCMSAPAPTPYKPATPDLVYIPTVSTTSSRPPPSSFIMPDSNPSAFNRRPLSLGAYPMSAPAISSVIAGSHTMSQGIDVFNVDFEFDSDEEEAAKAKQNARKSSSLSRAFGRKKRRTWSSGSQDTPPPPPPSSFFAKSEDSKRRHSQGAYSSNPPPPMMGISMSGEIELRMSLAAMEQRERAQRREQQQRDGVVNPVPEPPPKYSFKPRPSTNTPASPERQGTPSSSASSSGMFARVKKFRKGIMKGILG
ncbi:hypothetical protein BKA70DRAFT_231894 [Coprinopsis sp. MPI-PUGE-AT-0042]|nr:hypothetical protein BKA70DRAFT_231894 [Coprinopsis sp. MPI-PUGE-AT-0042]